MALVGTSAGYSTYIMASKRNGTIYVGATNNLRRRVYEHKNEINQGFTSKYNIKMLVYYQKHDSPIEMIYAEKKLKKLKRDEKLDLIEGFNPDWVDLYTCI